LNEEQLIIVFALEN